MTEYERGLEEAAKQCEEGAVGSGVLFEWEGALHALGESGVAALRYMASQFREQIGRAPASAPRNEEGR